jgi:hypothetical protein
MTMIKSITAVINVNTEAYPDWTDDNLVEACGLIPHWLAEFDFLTRVGAKQFIDLKEYMENCYGFGELYKMGGTVDPDTQQYISSYEEAKPHEPYAKVILEGGSEALIYAYAIVAVSTREGYVITRMD